MEITISALNEVVYSYEQPVYVNILDLCLQSQVFTSQTLTNFEYNIGDADLQHGFTAYVDSPQSSTGQILCGAISYGIVDADYNAVDPSQISVSGTTITLTSTSDYDRVTNANA